MEAAVGVRKGGPTSEKLRYAMAVAQHHDAVSGTSKQVSDVPDMASKYVRAKLHFAIAVPPTGLIALGSSFVTSADFEPIDRSANSPDR